MKPAPFDYYAPRKLEDALALLGTLENARPLAGGQSLVPMMNLRVVTPDHLIDLNHITELKGVVETPDCLRIGAMTRQREIEKSSLVAKSCPILSLAVAHIGHQQTRNRGTIGGSICHLDPGAELPVVASAVDAKMLIVGCNSTRSLSMKEFALDYLTNQLADDELLIAVEFPKFKQRTGAAFEEFARRPADLAIVSVASVVRLSEVGAIEKLAIAIGGLGAGPVRLRDFEKLSVGIHFDEGFVRMACDAARNEPALGQGEYSSEYRSHLAGVLCARSLRNAVQQIN